MPPVRLMAGRVLGASLITWCFDPGAEVAELTGTVDGSTQTAPGSSSGAGALTWKAASGASRVECRTGKQSMTTS
ncbi:hypothetical protein GCM10018966_095030 [Streptomyces yanii]